MGLSEEHKEWLADLYESWGLDKVRRELDRSERNRFAPPEVTAFARAWVGARETAIRRKENFSAALAIVFGSLIGASLGLVI